MIHDLSSPGQLMTGDPERQLSNYIKDTTRAHRFPGSQPVTFQTEHLSQVKPKGSYVVCEKSDGCRYLLLLMKMNAYLVSTKMHFYRIDPPLPINLEYVAGTLLDGELVIDTPDPNDPSRKETNFYVFDAISIRNQYVGGLPLTDRLRLAAGGVIALALPPQEVMSRGLQVPMFLRLKRMFAANDARYVWDEIVQAGKLHHESDGLIFTQNPVPYVLGTCRKGEILKWKPPHLNSVDFGIGPVMCKNEDGMEVRYFCKLFWNVRGTLAQYTESYILLEEDNQELFRRKAIELQREVVITECYWDPNWSQLKAPEQGQPWSNHSLIPGGGWRYMRFREDKPYPNADATVINVIKSIRNPLESEVLFSALEEE